MSHFFALFLFFSISHCLGWTSAFLLAVHRLCGVIEGRFVYAPDIPCTGSWTLPENRSELKSDALPATTVDFSGI